MKRIYSFVLLTAFAFMCAVTVRVELAMADDAGSAIAAAGSGSSSAAAAPALSSLHDPVAHPGDAFADVRGAWHYGWPVGVLVGAFLLLRAAQELGDKWPTLGKLEQGRVKIVIAGGVAIATAAITALAGGGGLGAVAGAAVLAALATWRTHGATPPATSTSSSSS